MAEEVRGRQMDFINPNNQRVTVFSTDGKDRTEAEFNTAMSLFQKTGRMPEGVTFYQKGSLGEGIRSGYEAVREHDQNVLEQGGGALGAIAGTSPAMLLAAKFGLISPQTARAPQVAGQKAGEAVGRFVGAPLNTLESTGSAIGGLAGAAMTSGLSVPFGGMTYALGNQAVRTGIGSGLGYLAGGALGGNPDPGKALIQGLMAGAAQGAFGVIKSAITGTVSQKAQEVVSKDLVNIIKNNLGDAGIDPAALKAYGADPKRFNELVQAGLKGFRVDIKDVADNIVTAVNNRAPNALSRQAARQIRSLADDFYDTGNKMLDFANSRQALAAGRNKLLDIQRQIMEVVTGEFPKLSGAAQKAVFRDIDASLATAQDQVNKMMPGAEVIAALKRSGADKGFSVEALQKEVQGYFAQNPGSAMEAAGRAAFRGAPSTATDAPVIRSFALPFSKKYIPGGIKVQIPLGHKYVGSVQSGIPETAAASAGQSAIQSFIRERND